MIGMSYHFRLTYNAVICNFFYFRFNTITQTGKHYSQETKELMFNVIKFIEGDKYGATIPLYNVNDRIMAALQISHGSLVNLKNELKQLEEEEQKVLEQKSLE